MSGTLVSPNMNITVPVALARLGPSWASDIQTAMYTVIDAHDHSPGKGVQVPTLGLNINNDLSFANGGTPVNATNLRSTRYSVASGALAIGSDVACLYAVTGTVNGLAYNGDAFWNNAAGTAIPITRGGVLVPALAYSQKTISGTSYAIPANETVNEYWFQATTVPTITLPAATSVASGRSYLFIDYQGTSAANPVTLAPNGTDKINGVNANYTLQNAFGSWLVTTDATGNGWVVTGFGTQLTLPYTISAAVTPSFTQAQSTTGAGATFTFQSQAAKAGSAANGGDFVLNTGAGDGAGRAGLFRMQAASVDTFDFWPWQGTRNTQQGVIQRVPFQLNTLTTSSVQFFSFAIPNNSSVGFVVTFVGRQTGTPANAVVVQAVLCATNSGGTVTTTGASPTTAATGVSPFTNYTSSASGTSVILKVTPATASSVDWQGFIDVVSN